MTDATLPFYQVMVRGTRPLLVTLRLVDGQRLVCIPLFSSLDLATDYQAKSRGGWGTIDKIETQQRVVAVLQDAAKGGAGSVVWNPSNNFSAGTELYEIAGLISALKS